MGQLWERDGKFSFKSKWQNIPAAAFSWFIENITQKAELPPLLEVRHEGSCGRCGRELTVPESIDRGIGPDCWAMMQADEAPESFL